MAIFFVHSRRIQSPECTSRGANRLPFRKDFPGYYKGAPIHGQLNLPRGRARNFIERSRNIFFRRRQNGTIKIISGNINVALRIDNPKNIFLRIAPEVRNLGKSTQIHSGSIDTQDNLFFPPCHSYSCVAYTRFFRSCNFSSQSDINSLFCKDHANDAIIRRFFFGVHETESLAVSNAARLISKGLFYT